jgi:hypothetical protein
MFFLLHEYGHLAELAGEWTGAPREGVERLTFDGDGDDELGADCWAACRLIDGIPLVADTNPLEIREALTCLFGYLEAIRTVAAPTQGGRGGASPRERLQGVLLALG